MSSPPAASCARAQRASACVPVVAGGAASAWPVVGAAADRQGGLEVGATDAVARRQRGQAPAQVLQFAHVAGPVVARAAVRSRACPGAWPARRSLRAAAARKRSASCGTSSRRSRNGGRRRRTTSRRCSRSARKPPSATQLLQVLVGRGDHAHVDADQFAPADAEELALGQHAQQPRLQRQRHVADLVEEQRAAVGLFEAAGVAARGAGEGAGFVAEQFAFQQFGRNRGGVERDEGLRARGDSRCSARATSSLPVPVSPVISTDSGACARRPMARNSSRIAGRRADQLRRRTAHRCARSRDRRPFPYPHFRVQAMNPYAKAACARPAPPHRRDRTAWTGTRARRRGTHRRCWRHRCTRSSRSPAVPDARP